MDEEGEALLAERLLRVGSNGVTGAARALRVRIRAVFRLCDFDNSDLLGFVFADVALEVNA